MFDSVFSLWSIKIFISHTIFTVANKPEYITEHLKYKVCF